MITDIEEHNVEVVQEMLKKMADKKNVQVLMTGTKELYKTIFPEVTNFAFETINMDKIKSMQSKASRSTTLKYTN